VTDVLSQKLVMLVSAATPVVLWVQLGQLLQHSGRQALVDEFLGELPHHDRTLEGRRACATTFRGKVAWEGEVEVFAVTGHPKAAHAYAWEHETDEGNRAFVAVLGVPPVNSAQDAVRASIVAEAKH